jgi:predicted ATP-dependent endonuclease of OLD family
VLVGKNDIGKSTILEALDIFFNEGRGSIKLDKDDLNKKALGEGRDQIEIAVEFEDLPTSIIIDSINETTLEDEFLLSNAGTLIVVKRYPNARGEKVFLKAMHPTNPECKDLLLKKNGDLKKLLSEQGIECADKTKNAALRKAIWSHQQDLALQECMIDVTKEDAKNIWEQLKKYLPLYTLFQSDRKNSDGDSEVQDPMRLVVKEIFEDAEILRDLTKVADTVKTRLAEVATRTLEKLREMNPEIANSLDPKLPDTAHLKWAEVFKNVAITGDEDIPVNKRGSGVKRLILLNFFRAEAERRQQVGNLPHIVYAIEEPETSQHPEHQRSLITALVSLSKSKSTQVLLTTHSPEIVKQLNFDDILLIEGRGPGQIYKVKKHELPYPSLNEVNYLAFGESSLEYHNELYGYIEAEDALTAFKSGKPTRSYNRLNKDGSLTCLQIVLTEYIRHQIHHPENTNNLRFTNAELEESICSMRDFLKEGIGPAVSV